MTYDPASITIMHRSTDSGFTAQDDITETYTCIMAVGADPVETRYHAEFPGLITYVQSWAEAVVEWRETPDLWELQHEWKFLSDQQYKESDNTPFTADEQDVISTQLAAIKESIKKTYELTAEQESRIDARFDEAEKAAKRLGRKDWILLFAGGIFSLILADAITPDIAQHILMMAAHGLEHLFTSGPRSIRAE